MEFFNKADNGIMVPKRSVDLDINGHTVHKKYSIAISDKISEICNKAELSDLEKMDKLQELIQNTKNTLKQEVILGSKNVNDIVNF